MAARGQDGGKAAEAAFKRLAREHYESFPACPSCGLRYAVVRSYEAQLDPPYRWRCGSCWAEGEGRLEA